MFNYNIYSDEGFTTFKQAAAAAISGGYVDEWLDSFDSYDDYQEASDAIDEVNDEWYRNSHKYDEWYRDAHLDDLPDQYK